MSLGNLAGALFNAVGIRIIVDKTGLAGFYDIRLIYANPLQQEASSAASPIPVTEPSAPVIFTAVRAQLGLKLVPETGFPASLAHTDP